MKLSFSTRGWRDLSWQEILDTAEEMGFQGVEFYHVSAAPELTDRSGPFHAYSVASAYRTLREKHLSIPCFDSACDISTADDARLEALREEMRLCSDLRAPFCAVCNRTIESVIAAHSDSLVTAVSQYQLPEPSLRVCPNPATDFIDIFVQQADAPAEILDMNGRIWKTVHLNNKANRVMISDLPRGVYLVHVNGETRKFVKQ